MKKILWTALVASLSAASAALAARAARIIWIRVAKEPPPSAPIWARWLVGKPVGAGIGATFGRTS